jgi:hypothetical protein
MGISYDTKNKKWNIEYENANRPILSEVSVNVPVTKYVSGFGGKGGTTWRAYQENVPVKFGLDDSFQEITSKLRQAGYTFQSNYLISLGVKQDPVIESVQTSQISAKGDNKRNQDANTIATTNNKAYDTIKKAADNAKITGQPDDYKKFLSTLNGTGTDDTVRKVLKNEFDSFYKTEIVSLWDQKNAAKVPFEGFENTIRFDPGYYKETDIGKSVKTNWDNAVKKGDLYILGQFPNYESYALWHYTNIGQNEARKKGIRDPGFKPVTPTDGFKYAKIEETVPGKTDAQRQFERDKIAGDILGLKQIQKPIGPGGTQLEQTYELKDIIGQYEKLVNSSQKIKDQWETAQAEILYAERFPKETKQPWAKLYDAVKEATGAEPEIRTEAGFGELLAKANQLDPSKYSGIQTLLGDIKKNPEVQKVDTKLSQYDIALTKVAGEAEAKLTQQAAVLQKQFLEDSRRELIKAKQLEQKFDLLSGTSFGQEILGLRENIANSVMQESGIGGLLAMGGKKPEDLTKSLGLSLDTGKVFGSNNGILYNWERWFYDQIEKKYAGGLDVPDDYVPGYQRTIQNGFATPEQIASWKKYDDAYERLKTNPGDTSAQNLVSPGSLPKDYVPVEKRKQTQKSWLDYEAQRREMGWVDSETLSKWSEYDDAYQTLQNTSATPEQKKKAQEIYNKRPKDYLEPGKRIDDDVKFAQDFFNDYLLPRFNASKSISEFRDYINVDRDKQNIFQTEDRLNTLKRAAESASVSWMKALDSLQPSKFNADYYFNPAGYYIEKGIGGTGDVPVLLGDQFQKEWGNALPDQYVKQKQDVETAWDAAKKGLITKNEKGNDINWQAKAYMYGLDVNKKEDFAKLHFEVVGQGKQYDSAPDVFSPKIAEIYLKQVLTPYLANKYAQIGTVFGQFVNPDDFAEEFVSKLDPVKNREQVEKVLKIYGMDPNTEDLTELKKMISDSIKSGTALDIREQIKQLNQAGETPTQELLGVEYIQRASDKREEAEAKSEDALFNRFKSAGYQGTEEDFYGEFMPDVTEEDRRLFQTAFGGKSLKDTYSFKPTGDPFSDLGKLEGMMSFGEEEEEETPAQKTTTTTARKTAEPKSKYFSFFPDEDTEEEEEPSSPVKIKRGGDILAEFKSRLKLSPTAGKSTGSDLSDPFSNSFFGSF